MPRFAPVPSLSEDAFREKFWSMVQPIRGCLVWTGYTAEDGYGLVSWRGKQRRSARLAWEWKHGKVAPGLQVLHRCDNPPCVNPDHLFIGTNADNMADKKLKGRSARGEQNGGGGRLDGATVLMIRGRAARGHTKSAIARSFGVSDTMIGKIVKRTAWAHL